MITVIKTTDSVKRIRLKFMSKLMIIMKCLMMSDFKPFKRLVYRLKSFMNGNIMIFVPYARIEKKKKNSFEN